LSEASFSLGPPPVPQSDRPYSHSRRQERKPYISFNGLLRHPSTINASHLPPSRESHSRRREPDHIPRPRNAFIIFRSSYISGRSGAGEGQQNELSKQAGNVWNRLTREEKEKYIVLAEYEKKRHQEMYPDYVYCPTRGAASRKSIAKPKKARKSSEFTPSVSSKSTTPDIPFAAPTLRRPRAAAQLAVQRFIQASFSPSPLVSPLVSPPPEDSPMQKSLEMVNSLVNTDVDVPASKLGTPIEDDFVPTADIPELELTPSKEVVCLSPMLPAFDIDIMPIQEPEHTFDFSLRPAHLNRIPEQFGFKCYGDSTVMLAHFPPMPNSASECSMLIDDDTPDFWEPPVLQQPAPDFSRRSVPGFTWSPHYDNGHLDHDMSFEDMMPEDELSFMTSIFDFDPLPQ
jgi:HMG (high mobility group) box